MTPKVEPPKDEIAEVVEIIAATIYAGGAIDKMNNPDLKIDLEKIPSDSRVRKGIEEILALIKLQQEAYLKRYQELEREELVNEIIAAQKEAKQEILSKVEAKLPDENILNIASSPYAYGYKTCLNVVRTIVNKLRLEL